MLTLNENDSSYILACIGIKDVFAELEMFCCMKWVRSNAKPSANVNKPQKGKSCFLHQKVKHQHQYEWIDTRGNIYVINVQYHLTCSKAKGQQYHKERGQMLEMCFNVCHGNRISIIVFIFISICICMCIWCYALKKINQAPKRCVSISATARNKWEQCGVSQSWRTTLLCLAWDARFI